VIEVVIGFFIAIAIAITGVGGGTITAPVLMLFLGIEPAVAVGTALSFSTIVKIPAGISYYLKGKIDGKYLAIMAAGGIPGVLTGTLLLRYFSENHGLKLFVLCAVGAIVLFSALVNVALMVRQVELKYSEKMIYVIPAVSFFIGTEVGFSSAGAGALGTLLLLHTTRLFACTVVGTDILFGLIISAVGGGLHISMGNMDLPLFAKLVSGGVFGSIIGSHIASRVPGKPLRVALLVWLIFIGSQLLYRGITG